MVCKKTHRHTVWQTHRQTDEHQKVKSKTTNTVNVGSPDPEYLYYPQDV